MNRSGVVTIIILLTILVLVFWYYLNISSTNNQELLEQNHAVNALSDNANYTDINGNPVSLSDYYGQSILAVSWASWCPDCVEQLQIFETLDLTDKDIVILAINRAESAETAKSFLQFYNLESSLELVLDPKDHFFDSIGGYAMPEIILFNKDGDVIHHKRNLLREEELVALLADKG